MDQQADPSPDKGTPERRPARRRQPDRPRPEPVHDVPQARPVSLAHPVVAGYNGSASARNALAYAAGMARRLGRPLLMVYVTSPGVYCEPLTGQVVGLLRDADSLERWLLTELDQAADASELEVHVRTRRGSPARELAAIAAEFSADALVIGAPRHFWHHLIGSVPSWLARNARCPVIVVPLPPGNATSTVKPPSTPEDPLATKIPRNRGHVGTQRCIPSGQPPFSQRCTEFRWDEPRKTDDYPTDSRYTFRRGNRIRPWASPKSITIGRTPSRTLGATRLGASPSGTTVQVLSVRFRSTTRPGRPGCGSTTAQAFW